jgi:hypothetical protein
MMSVLLSSTSPPNIDRQLFSHQVKQPREVVEAFRVCERFERLLGENLDFDRAYESTFTKNVARRRAIAIADGEFGNLDLTGIDDVTLIDAYKSRMQIFYLMLPLASPDSTEQELLFFPPDIKQIFDRKPPSAAQEFRSYGAQLKRDVANLRAHLEQLATLHPEVAERISKFKAESLSVKLRPPKYSVVKPPHDSGRGEVLGKDEAHYEINGYTVIREDGQMRIVGIRFFTRLF